MTWEETIKYIRTQPEFADLVEKAYFDDRLELNADRFIKSKEWEETLKLIKKYASNARTILDVGTGNGISSIAFALEGYNVTAIEPDPSDTIGAGAIRKLKELNKLDNISVIEAYAENANFENRIFDVVYCRQSMHHANNLNSFVNNISSFLKVGGLFFAVRDHVVFNKTDKEWFLNSHPLQKYYGGENAFKPAEYRSALKKAGLKLIRELKYYDSIINYFPLMNTDLVRMRQARDNSILNASKKIPLTEFLVFRQFFRGLYNIKHGKVFNERTVPGRMYSYIAVKTK